MKLKFMSLLLLIFIARLEAHALALPTKLQFTDEICEDFKTVAGEFVDMELSGLRWQGTTEEPTCLVKLITIASYIDRIPASDPGLLDPEFLIPENRKVDFIVKRLPNDLLEVMMNYIGKKNKKDFPIKDHFLLKLNFGSEREKKGCASWYSEPEHFVMRSRCWKN